MNIKEQESQLRLNLNLRIVITLIVYLLLSGFVAYRLYSLGKTPKLLDTGGIVIVPVLKEDDFETLRTSVKSIPSIPQTPIVRPEPFD